MTRQERAKQFAPFDAMKGLYEALRIKEERHGRTERRCLSEDELRINCAALGRIEKSDIVSIDCYLDFHNVTVKGRVSEVSMAYRFIRIEEQKIWFDDIYAVHRVDR